MKAVLADFVLLAGSDCGWLVHAELGTSSVSKIAQPSARQGALGGLD